MKKIITLLIIVAMLSSLAVTASADSITTCVVVGANLTDSQIQDMYTTFGVTRGNVLELTVTNSEERQYLEGLVDESIIGHNSISCVCLKILPENSGISVKTENITWCTSEMYISALTTAGITDAEIIVAAPFEVSGTAALTGIYKAYEALTGDVISEQVKQVSTEELTIGGEIAELIGSEEAAAIINELKLILDETASMSDSELHDTIVSIAAQYGVSLTESEISKLISLCRSLEGLDVSSISESVEKIYGTIQKINETKETVTGIAQKVQSFFTKVSAFIDKVKSIFSK